MHDVAIIGAGPAGSTTAAVLAERGFDVVVLERARFPRPKPCAEYLSPEATRILDRLGLPARIDRYGPARLVGMRIVGPSGASFVGRFAASHGFRAYRDHGLALPREILDALIADAARARGAEVREGVRAEAIAVRHDGVEITLRSEGRPATIRARMLIGADGLNSRVARQLGLSRRASLLRVALVTHATGVLGMGAVGGMHGSRGGYVGPAPRAQGVANGAI